MRYLGVELSSILYFKKQIKIARTKALKTTVLFSYFMPTLKGPRSLKRKLLIPGSQCVISLRVNSAYRTVSTTKILVVANMSLVHLTARGLSEIRLLLKNGWHGWKHWHPLPVIGLINRMERQASTWRNSNRTWAVSRLTSIGLPVQKAQNAYIEMTR